MTRAALAPLLVLAAACSAPVPIGPDVPAAAAGQPRLVTRWGRLLDRARPLPEHPRPTLVRETWRNLNGPWQFEPGLEGQPAPIGRPLRGEILVPFPVESALSGVGEHHARAWYKRTFDLDPTWRNERVLLHFGAVDWEAEVWVNGIAFPVHRGGYEPFTHDITAALLPGIRTQEIVVRVFDPTDAGEQPRGKQVLDPTGIWYSPVTGIWQTVWLEAVPRKGIDGLEIEPDLDRGGVTVTALGRDVLEEDAVEVEVLERGGLLGARKGAVGAPLYVPIAGARTWSPDDPFLYDLRVTRTGPDGRVRDRVTSYFGLRTAEVREDEDGVPRFFLNGEPLFAAGLLDQGWWPDGLYTAPADDALRADVALAKSLGFNLLRKHVKVEPERWYTWCDRLGVLVWQDMPNGDNESAEGRAQFERELEGLVRARRHHPSIVQWVVFNEGWGQFDTERLTGRVRELDPTRLVTGASGWHDRAVGDAVDVHHYPGPRRPESPGDARMQVLGEYGGLSLPIAGHVWDEDSWGYATAADSEDLAFTYEFFQRDLARLREEGLAAAVYTQLSDVERETNGLVTYDREVVKVEAERIARANRGELPALTTVLATSERSGAAWEYRFDAPPDGWRGDYGGGLDLPGADGWAQGVGGFGAEGTPGTDRALRTAWESAEIWMRAEFRVVAPPRGELVLRVHHDEDVEVWVNGVLVHEAVGFTTGYEVVRTGLDAETVLRAGDNVVAVHCRNTEGGQFVDVGLDVVERP